MPYRKSAHNFPTMRERHAARTEQALAALDECSAIATAQDRSKRQHATVKRPSTYRWLALFILLAGLLGGLPPNDAHAAARSPAPYVCPAYEDGPRWDWVVCGNGFRGVILRSAPKHCTWSGTYHPGCITVVSARRYCTLRRRGAIDRRRTPSLLGDGKARTSCLV